jgi:hypothetical protein
MRSFLEVLRSADMKWLDSSLDEKVVLHRGRCWQGTPHCRIEARQWVDCHLVHCLISRQSDSRFYHFYRFSPEQNSVLRGIGSDVQSRERSEKMVQH